MFRYVEYLETNLIFVREKYNLCNFSSDLGDIHWFFSTIRHCEKVAYDAAFFTHPTIWESVYFSHNFLSARFGDACVKEIRFQVRMRSSMIDHPTASCPLLTLSDQTEIIMWQT